MCAGVFADEIILQIGGNLSRIKLDEFIHLKSFNLGIWAVVGRAARDYVIACFFVGAGRG